MAIIKRYANRKLYDTEAKQYVTLEDLADLIRQGEDVRVVDHVTGEDITSVTLLQVIFEEEKKIGGLLPQLFMTRLIRAGSDTVSSLRSRLATLAPFSLVDEEIRRRVQELQDQGRVAEAEAGRMLDLLVRKPARDEEVRIPVRGEDGELIPIVDDVEAGLPAEEPADPQEVEALLRQVEALEEELASLRTAGGPPLVDVP